ncbi:protein CELLULOSE SYNTHASE INTERACTIVE 1-like [Salvia divinorum]|uniref:Protein CELLULOSE SYNTHASE INTERACTIVE 1-like n=1 Tax=Salvia divinorum TaxID=28513 RepID=A0ABD1I5Y3_SALDI
MGEEETAPSSSSATDKQQLKQVILQISSLISVSHSIKVFTAKWQAARIKLEELFSHLAAIENCGLGGKNEPLSAAVEEILATLANYGELARRCSESSYSGKLLMQSDLDMLSARLDAHVGSLRDIYAAGMLEQSHALVVSRASCASASKDDVRFYLNDVVSRLKIGGKVMKMEALIAFNEVIREDDRCIKIGIEIDSFLNLLVNLLDFQEEDVVEEAAAAVSSITEFPPGKAALIAAGAIAPLIRVVESGSELSKEFAARCLIKMTENSDNVWAVSAHGGVPALLKICCGDGASGSELVCLACGVLKNLAAVEEIKRFMVEDGAVAGLVALARSRGDEAAQISALDLLQTMAYRDESIREAIITRGGIPMLVGIMDPALAVSTKLREVAFRSMTMICLSCERSMLSSGLADHILHFLRFGEGPVQELALKASFWLCGASEYAKKAMGDAGFMPVIVKFLDSKSFEIREIAAETLSSMLAVPKNRKRFVQNDENVVVLMQMLDPEQGVSGNKKLLLSILMSLARSNSARKKMLSSGYLKNIEKLAEDEDEDETSDAKKIVRKLSSTGFRNVFNVFWHS